MIKSATTGSSESFTFAIPGAVLPKTMSKPTSTTVCSQCSTALPTFTCLSCNEPLCKRCAQFADQDTFEWQSKMPAGLQAGAYCNPCFTQIAQPKIEAYKALSERADRVALFEISQSKETRFFKRNKKLFHVANCVDRREAEIRLAYMAAEAGFFALVDVDIRAEKLHTGGSYKKSNWNGTAMPVDVDPNKLKVRT